MLRGGGSGSGRNSVLALGLGLAKRAQQLLRLGRTRQTPTATGRVTAPTPTPGAPVRVGASSLRSTASPTLLHRPALSAVGLRQIQSQLQQGNQPASAWLDERPAHERPQLHFRKRNANKSHIVLMGPPGSGKTSVGRLLAQQLSRPFLDVDDDVLEPSWGTSVSSKLAELGDDKFLAAEGEALMKFPWPTHEQPSVIALTGSNPLHSASLAHLARDGLLVYLDVASEDILQRMNKMKVDRIVGQSALGGLEAVLAHRRRVYENNYDHRVLVEHGETAEHIASKIVRLLRRKANEGYVSTRGYSGSNNGHAGGLDFLDVVAQGLSPDRGLFVPSSLADMRFSPGELARLQGLSYEETALRVLERFPLGQRLHPSELRRLLYEAYASFNTREVLPITPLRATDHAAKSDTDAEVSAAKLHENLWLMETFHGPTASFKDLSLQLLPRLLRAALEHKHAESGASSSPPPRVGLLVATSGDTGTAALDGFSRVPGYPVIVLYPAGGVSIVQQAQMQTAAGDVLVLGVRGADFDWCQSAVKEIFNDGPLNARWRSLVPNLHLSSANSMNFGRFAPQIVFAIRAYLRLLEQGRTGGITKMGDPVDLVVPTGNFGNILGALYAKRVLGLPLRRIVCASNANNVLYSFLTQGVYDRRHRTLELTMSPSIDILVSSNLERFLHLLLADGNEASSGTGSPKGSEEVKRLFESLAKEGHFSISPELLSRVREEVQAGWCSEDECLATIRATHARTGVLIDPHTAVAVHVANTMLATPATAEGETAANRVPVIVASTAHWGKFPHAMARALGKEEATTAGQQQQQAELARMLAQLESLSPSYARSMHPQLAALATAPVLHAEQCDASLSSVVERITQFLVAFQARQQATAAAGKP